MQTDIPQVYRHHVFACFQSRPAGHPRGSCGQQGSEPLWKRLGQAIEGLRDPRVAMTATGCLGFCRAGPLMVIYPAGVWYAVRTEADVDEIVASHLGRGEIVERLAIVPQP
ncbi:(2Fe-2S) ferredoxin domain-containing protein [Siculibacillus lacustris]|uniref:(2Fe-2S) ferredoxin domain-containing protein n=1 Tax=Siculibacillus lacustris TaxID=1549641 RepID=A0A4Q9VQJ9_9HYPH|nr:(2Fe-2S) ferredoxin domain-containing protein [Siculibacillus lacustris]TBW37583.1 (2Fe-2S) ferredoxin domain-containing protein [Siculibacillus lacustris]